MSLFQLPLRSERRISRKAAAAAAAAIDGHLPEYHRSARASSDEGSPADEAPRRERRRKSTSPLHLVGERPSNKHRSQKFQHVAVLVTLIHRCIQKRQWDRGLRAFSLLVRVADVDIKLCYDMALEILLNSDPDRATELLARLIVAFPPLTQHMTASLTQGIVRLAPRADVFVRLLTVHRIRRREYLIAVQALDEWLLVPPFRDDKTLWRYMGFICSALVDEARDKGDEAAAARWQSKRIKADRMNRVDAEVDEQDNEPVSRHGTS